MKKSVSRTLAMGFGRLHGSRHFGRLWKQRFFRGRFQRS